MELREKVKLSLSSASVLLTVFIAAISWFLMNHQPKPTDAAPKSMAMATVKKNVSVKQVVGTSKNAVRVPAKKIIAAKSDPCGRFKPALNKTSKAEGVAPTIISAVIKIESNCNPNAKGGNGEIGLMQIKPTTAGVKANPEKLLQPAYNIHVGTRYLRRQYDKFGSWEGAVLAYNRGPEGARKLIANGMKPGDHWHVKKFVRQMKIELSAKR